MKSQFHNCFNPLTTLPTCRSSFSLLSSQSLPRPTTFRFIPHRFTPPLTPHHHTPLHPTPHHPTPHHHTPHRLTPHRHTPHHPTPHHPIPHHHIPNHHTPHRLTPHRHTPHLLIQQKNTLLFLNLSNAMNPKRSNPCTTQPPMLLLTTRSPNTPQSVTLPQCTPSQFTLLQLPFTKLPSTKLPPILNTKFPLS